MYIPRSFRIGDHDTMYDFVTQHSFAVMTSVVDGALYASHLIFQLDREGNRLLFHMARANPHWRAFDGKTEALVVFAGAHAYISPAWYTKRRAVPTWNYQAVHIAGYPRLVEDRDVVREQMDALVEENEQVSRTGWSLDEAGDLADGLMDGIMALEMEIVRMEGQYKLSQNKPAAEREGVIAGLEANGDAGARAIAAAMRRLAD